MDEIKSILDAPRNDADALVTDLCELSALKESDDDRYALWTIGGIAFFSTAYGFAAVFEMLRNPSEILLGVALVAWIRFGIAKARLSRRSRRYSELRDRVARRYGNQLLWNSFRL
jgi:hypothetical protein